MTDGHEHCPDDHLLVELALGELTGRERADVLAHLLACPACREQTDLLVEVCERLLLAAPDAEPPAGFESTVLEGLRTPAEAPRRQRSLVRLGAVAAALVVGVIVGGLVAPQGASEMASADMVTPTGRDVGRAWRYDSDPDWVFLSVPGWEVWEHPEGSPLDYHLVARLDDGSTADLGAVTFREDAGTWATTTSIDTSRVRAVAVVDQTGRTWCEGSF